MEATNSILQIAQAARTASHKLQSATAKQKSAALHRIHQYLKENREEILAANKLDLENARKEVEAGKLSSSLFKRLDLGAGGDKYESLLQGVLDVERLPDPTGQVTLATKMDEGLELYRVTYPVGVLLIIFEARPEVVVQISCLAIKSGNAVILKGGKEAAHSNAILQKTLQNAIASLTGEDAGVPENAVQLVSTRSEIAELLKMDQYIDLVIPRGSNQLVRHVQENTRIPVLGHADGLCSVYVDTEADIQKATKVVVDSKVNYPAACNASETLLINERVLNTHLVPIAEGLLQQKVELRCDERSFTLLHEHIAKSAPEQLSKIVQAVAEDYDTEFLELRIAVKVVGSLQEAIEHINAHGSRHTDAIVTENKAAAEQFMRQVDAAGVYWNASTRFADGFRYGFGAEIGVSTNKTHARGPVGLEGLVIYKYCLYGTGEDRKGYAAGDYGSGKKRYLHEPIPLDENVKRSGQVVVDLSIAVKELIENSLDAGATSIEIRLKDYDNGTGIDPSNYESLALKHYTSKLSVFEDLYSVSSFGFRGEALSSLCAVSKLCVVSATGDQAPLGMKLEYDSHGKLVQKSPLAREQGTTVMLTNFFEALPVRFREFKKNIKREYSKCLELIQAYALICDGVKISCSNQTGKGSTAVATHANQNIKDNISNVFGAKILPQLMEVKFEFSDPSSEEHTPIAGAGRGGSDRQFYYINKRPCTLPKKSENSKSQGSTSDGEDEETEPLPVELSQNDTKASPSLLKKEKSKVEQKASPKEIRAKSFERKVPTIVAELTKEREICFDNVQETMRTRQKRRRKEPGEQPIIRTAQQATSAFHASIKLGDDSLAERELDQNIRKTDFASMRVVGQFNLGFIIAKLGRELFIVDQHASDEKFNYETLIRTSRIEAQKLLCPITPSLTPQQELIVSESLDFLRQHGFDVRFDENAKPSHRVKLLTLPHCRKLSLNLSDFEELVCKLVDGAAKNVRCSRLTAMFASKACRTAVMIGKPLDTKQMTKSTMSSPRRRIETDVMKLLMSDYEVTLVHDNMQEFYVRFHGPKDTPFSGGVWKVHVELPDQYPYKSPSIGFMNKIFHPNIDELSGSVCLDVINQTWSPMFDMINIFEVFLPQLLRYPNPTDPLNGEAAALLMREPSAYDQRVRDYVSKYATKEAADAATDESSDEDEMSSIGSYSDDETGGMEL
ncbi:hypothetical protein HK102_000561 [Quaeritorhiza haematococci]|nr:hypothetical protein HK102_000561 [Quaeritorhiza haematococci]